MLSVVYEFGDIPVDTVAAFVPPVSAIHEVKDVVKEALKLPGKGLRQKIPFFKGR